MKKIEMARILLAAGLGLGLGCGVALGQSAGQEMKNAGHDTKAAAVDTGHATDQTTRKVVHKTSRGRRRSIASRRIERTLWPRTRRTERRLRQGHGAWYGKGWDKIAGKPDSR